MLADGSYGAVRERLLQGLVYCSDTEWAQLGFPMSEEGGFFERKLPLFIPNKKTKTKKNSIKTN